jgi:hypothetical protein
MPTKKQVEVLQTHTPLPYKYTFNVKNEDEHINQPELTTMMTGHGKIKAHLHRFKLIDSATCPCRDNTYQTTDHIIYDCELLKTQRDNLKLTVCKTDSWPANKHTLISRHYSAFKEFINQIDFDELQ